MVSVGYSAATETRVAAREALQAAGVDQETGWLLVMAGRRHDPERLLSLLQQNCGDIPVYGGSCVGAISNHGSGYTGSEIVIAAFSADAGPPRASLVEPLEESELDAGRKLADWLVDNSVSDALLLYDVVRQGGGINVGSTLLDGIYESLPADFKPAIFGAGVLGDFPLTESYLFAGDRVCKNAALLLAIPEGTRTRTRVMHGCTPVSRFMRVTSASSARIHELDGEPAAQVLRRLAGSDDVALAFSVLLGRRSGDAGAPFDETDFINRLIIDVDEDDGSVALFEADISEGDEVQVMMRDNRRLMDSVQHGVTESMESIDPATGVLALYVDCAGRASVFTGSEEEESAKVAALVGDRLPLFGFYAGREIAPFAGRSRPLDWTGVLVLLEKGAPA